eukprot:2456886-Ditylum_brightwellii.AAC.1
MRELGFHDHVFDLIDKQPLTKEELKHFLFLLFGEEKSDSIPDPNADWCGFVKEVEKLLVGEKCQWNPVKKEVMPWIDIKELKKKYGKKTSMIKRVSKSFSNAKKKVVAEKSQHKHNGVDPERTKFTGRRLGSMIS